MTDTPTVETFVCKWGERQYALVPPSLAAVGDDVTVVRGTAPAGMVPAWIPEGCELRRLRDVPKDWEWQNSGGDWQTAGLFDAEYECDGLVVCRPKPAPKPRTETVPWHQALGRKLPDGRRVVEVSRDEGLAPWLVPTDGEPLRVTADDGMVTVLVEDNPTDTTDDDQCPRCHRKVSDHQLATVANACPSPNENPTARCVDCEHRWIDHGTEGCGFSYCRCTEPQP